MSSIEERIYHDDKTSFYSSRVRRGGAHGKNEKDALKSLADSIKEYVLTDVENDAIDAIFDPAHGQYWRMYNELEAKETISKMKRSLKKSFKSATNESIRKSSVEINYA